MHSDSLVRHHQSIACRSEVVAQTWILLMEWPPALLTLWRLIKDLLESLYNLVSLSDRHGNQIGLEEIAGLWLRAS